VNLSLLLLIGLALPFTYVHEFGHVLVCMYYGAPVTELGLGHTQWAFNSENMLYYVFGGVFASLVALAPLTVKRIRQNKGIVIVLLTLSLYNVFNDLIESFYHDTCFLNNVT